MIFLRGAVLRMLSILAIDCMKRVLSTVTECSPLRLPGGLQQPVCTGNGIAIGSQCTSTCLPDYFRSNNSTNSTTCSDDGEWTGELNACVADRCQQWADWSPCNWCNDTGHGNRTRVRICERGGPHWEWQVCQDGCNECTDQETMNIDACRCEGGRDDGIAVKVAKCKNRRGVVRQFETIVPCQCKGCRSSPCRNMGACIPMAHDTSYKCSCLESYNGVNCETPRACGPSTCHNKGQCLMHNGDMVCACPPIVTGHHCLSMSRCGHWEPFGCPSCGHWLEVRMCMANDRQQVHIRNFTTPGSSEFMIEMAAVCKAVLCDNFPSNASRMVVCQWGLWSRCHRINLDSIYCTQHRRYMCYNAEHWLPLNHTWKRRCQCGTKRTLLVHGRRTEWETWRVDGIMATFLRQEHIEARWVGTDYTIDQIFVVESHPDGCNATMDMPQVGALIEEEPTTSEPDHRVRLSSSGQSNTFGRSVLLVVMFGTTHTVVVGCLL